MSREIVEGKMLAEPEPDLTDPDNPELTEADFAKMRSPDEVLAPEILAQFPKAKVGRPKSEAPKVHVSARFAPDLVEFYKRQGKGWAAAMEAVLREHMERSTALGAGYLVKDVGIVRGDEVVGGAGILRQDRRGALISGTRIQRDAEPGRFETGVSLAPAKPKGKRA